MTLGLAVAAALGAAASWPTIRLPTFLRIMSELFAVETAVFGLVTLAEVAQRLARRRSPNTRRRATCRSPPRCSSSR